MPHHVFISYPSEERTTADRMCEVLEAGGVVCWYAPRDMPGGASWAGAIMGAIRDSRAMVLVYSTSTNTSEHVLREVNAAANADVPIFTFRIDRALPSADLEFFLGNRQWIDAQAPPLDGHLRSLLTRLRQVDPATTRSAEPNGIPEPPRPRVVPAVVPLAAAPRPPTLARKTASAPRQSPTRAWHLLWLLPGAAVVVFAVLMATADRSVPVDPTPPAPTPVEPRPDSRRPTPPPAPLPDPGSTPAPPTKVAPFTKPRVLGSARWENGPVSMAVVGEALYVVENARLHRVDVRTGAFEVLSMKVSATTLLSAGVSGHDSDLFSLETPVLGWFSFTLLKSKMRLPNTPPWRQPNAMCSGDGSLFVVDSGRLHRVDLTLEVGQTQQIGGEHWAPPVSIAFAEPHLYAVQNTKLWRVDPRSGDFRRLGSTTWTKEARCASDGRRLYVLDGALHEVDVRTGELRRSTSPMWRVDPMAIACGAGAVFVIENGRLHRIDDAR